MASIGNQQLTQGWYLTGGIVVAISFGNTRAAPVILGILVVALIYQLTYLLENIPPGASAAIGGGNPPTPGIVGPNRPVSTGTSTTTFA